MSCNFNKHTDSGFHPPLPVYFPVRFRHKGCQSEIIRYVGQEPLVGYTEMKSAEWQFPDGSHPEPYSAREALCPDCGKLVDVRGRFLEEIRDAVV